MTAATAMPANPVQQASLKTVIARLGNFIEAETAEIQSNRNFDFQASSEKKSRLLFELNRASRGCDFSQLDRSVIQELMRLKQALAENEVKINAHLSAIREVSDLMVNIMKNEEADGTYGEVY